MPIGVGPPMRVTERVQGGKGMMVVGTKERGEGGCGRSSPSIDPMVRRRVDRWSGFDDWLLAVDTHHILQTRRPKKPTPPMNKPQ